MIIIAKAKYYLTKADEKTIRLIKNILLSVCIKGISIIVTLFMMPNYIRFFDNQSALGMWFTAISILTWILTVDFGIGNGLRNHLVKPLVENDSDEIKKYISSAYISLSAIVLFFLTISYFVVPLVDWHKVFNISDDLVEMGTLMFMIRTLFSGVMLNFVLKLITSIFYAMQKSALPSLLVLFNSILLLLYITLAKTINLEYNIKSLSVVHAIATNAPYIIATIVLFKTSFKNCAPSFRFFRKQYAEKIIKLGGMFFWLQLLFMIIFGTNEFFITWLSKPENVVEFQIYNKLFAIIGTFFNLALTPVWSAVREACVKKDYNWIKKLYKKLNFFLLLLIPCEFILIIFLQIVVNVWLSENAISINYTYATIFAIYNIIFMKLGVDTSIVNGLGILKTQFIMFVLAVIVKIPLSVLFINITGSWISIVIVNSILILPYCIIQPINTKRYFDNAINKEGDSINV